MVLLAALAVGANIMVFAPRTDARGRGAAIRRRYAVLPVRVHPMSAPQGRPIIDVTTFPTLAKPAERYGILALHRTAAAPETFVVQDENITSRYQGGTESIPAEPQRGTAPRRGEAALQVMLAPRATRVVYRSSPAERTGGLLLSIQWKRLGAKGGAGPGTPWGKRPGIVCPGSV